MEGLTRAIHTGLIDRTIPSNMKYRPRLLVNNERLGMQMLKELENHLNACETFDFSVAFIAKSGLAVLKQTLFDLGNKGVKGRLITSTYLGFNSPEMFAELLKFSNLEVRLFEDEHAGFHPKGYLFKEQGLYNVIVGSSNLTQSALQTNKEWNLFLTATENGEIVDEVREAFEKQWQSSIVLTKEWIAKYKETYIPQNIVHEVMQRGITPNKMQKEALDSLRLLREKGKDKAILISATGTGKTFLSAFDVAAYQPKRMLFVVHRENIARAAMRTFKRVIKDKTMGMFTGHEKDHQADYLFTTVQTIAKPEYYEQFRKSTFDYIVIDEVHRAGAPTYQRLMSYFKPEFLLGMTATPERSDDFDIYQLFDYNIAYEIRLSQAMEYDLLCPFHYYGITDLMIDHQIIDDHTQFNDLVADVRVDYIIEKIEQYGHCGDQVKGLIFCSRTKEARTLSELFNQRGYRTTALTGEDSEERRQQAMDDLESGQLQYIFTVDIFNEGIDIPAVNQVVMLRATESAIIFIQQLGRGLRKYPHKDYVVVLDFIGNYEKNYLIPIALSGVRSGNKDDLRHFVMEGSTIVPGCSTIHFDAITKERIFKAIDQVNFSVVRVIKEAYKQLKSKLGHIPSLRDFDTYESIDPLLIFQNKSLGCYHVFLKKYEKDYTIDFDQDQVSDLIYISRSLAAGKRVHELEAIKIAIEDHDHVMQRLKETLKDQYDISMTHYSYDTIINTLTQRFTTGTGANTYKSSIFIDEDQGDYRISRHFLEELENKEFKKQVLELLDFGIHRYKQNYAHHEKDSDLCLYAKYTYDDVCRLLNWHQSVVPLNIGGYKYDERTNTFPVFINYDKDEDISDTTKYEDHLIDQETLVAYSKSGRSLASEEVRKVYDEAHSHIQVHLFMRKNKDDETAKEFYYLGRMHAFGTPQEEIMPQTQKSVVKLFYKLEKPIRKDLYDYITSSVSI